MRMLAWLLAVMTVPSITFAAPPEVEAAYEKGEELNEKYDFVETSKKAAADAFEKAKNASK